MDDKTGTPFKTLKHESNLKWFCGDCNSAIDPPPGIDDGEECPECGSSDGHWFCGHCGQAFDDDPTGWKRCQWCASPF